MLLNTIISLKIRISKLEKYAEYQDKVNEDHNCKIKRHIWLINLLLKANNESQVINNKKTTGLTFEEAMISFKQGKNVKRTIWDGFFLNLDKYNKTIIMYDLKLADIMSSDWEIID
jgi:hypothetical protein